MKHSVKKNCVTIMKAVKQIKIISGEVTMYLYLLKLQHTLVLCCIIGTQVKLQICKNKIS